MPLVLQLTKKLTSRPKPILPPGVRLRHFAGDADIEAWLELRRRAFARQKVGIGDWNAADFQREFLAKPWWRPAAMCFAEIEQPLTAGWQLAGTVTLARRGIAPQDVPVVHWLAVHPTARRRGIGRLLMTALERTVWDQGERQIFLETHQAWTEAGRLYTRLGYQAVNSL